MRTAALSFLLIVIVGVADYFTGTDISLSLFYLVPVILCSWYINRTIGFAAAFLCGMAALASDAAFGRNMPVVFWNTAVRTSIFVLVAFLMAALRHSQNRLQRNENDLKNAMDDLKRSNQELEQFASSASHDLQEPLRKIVTFGDRIDIKKASLSEPEKEYFEKIKQAAIRMQRLIEDLLLLSKVSSQKSTYEEVDLNDVLHEVQQDLELRIIESGGYVEIGRLPRIHAQRFQMKQLFLNLLSNSLKYRKSTEPPNVRIGAKVLESDWIEVKVKDNGIGFDEKDTERIFRAFDRLHSKSEYEGTGLGMPICQKIVERHGGRISAKGVKGEGATFTVLLPIRKTT